ncbi:hypothetical protein [Halobacillus sp. A5]|uniref:hypothetical protein n=1 Tax=Halobacillus sp. A5 TaxID=2880263 RepID=UPI0020A6546D|nr:hypothetical protein [Halobacillus sp. A5]
MKALRIVQNVYLAGMFAAIFLYFSGMMNGDYLFPIVGGSFLLNGVSDMYEEKVKVKYVFQATVGVFLISVPILS